MWRRSLVTVAIWAWTSAAAPGRAAEAQELTGASERVAEALRREASEGDRALDRWELLWGVLDSHPDFAPARWQAGHVRHNGEWLPFEEAARRVEQDGPRGEYLRRRQSASDTPEGHLELANWCRKHELPERERAHLIALLAKSPGGDLTATCRRLGYRLAGGQWLTPEQRRSLDRSAAWTERALRTWGPKLAAIARRMRGTPAQRAEALSELEAIDGPSAVPAIEAVLSASEEDSALLAVQALARIDAHQSSGALARQAAFSPWPRVRSAATAALKGRPPEEFAPQLLAAMHSPATWEYRVLISGYGRVRYWESVTREMADHWQVARRRGGGQPAYFWYRARRLLEYSDDASERLDAESAPRHLTEAIRQGRLQLDAARQAGDALRAHEARVAAHNEQAAEHNERVGAVLAEAAGRPVSAEPGAWWQWWVEYSDIEPGPKPVVVSEEDATPPPVLVVRSSCLAAGTPVWTESGPEAVETIKVGDLVLSKDVETGELAYRPVLLTTVRRPTRLVRLRVGGEEVCLTGGHHVWASGRGWVKARELQPGDPLHTATGMRRVEAVEPAGEAEVYNLVVADSHTYFFGESLLLSHDVTTPGLTNAKVPGLPAE